jgi:3-hydroxyacyl-CoA dehydrogenase/enoyl-CoA hydratase/3-hydroxybutyryl-CoA epimerase
MQTALQRPQNFGGMHFFNPVHRMPLVEVIRGEKTSDETVAKIYQFTKQLGKTPIVVKDRAGFLVNRLLLPYMNEAIWVLNDGATIEDIDRALIEFGMPMGPIELVDEVGVDVGEKVSHILNQAFGARMEPAPLNTRVVEAKRLGKKNGKGFYDYADASGKKKTVGDEIYRILNIKAEKGKIPAVQIVDRCILPMINEASRCLEEQIVHSAEDVDLGMIMGTGFPPFRGGLLKYADDRGLRTILSELQALEKRFGLRYQPSPALLQLVEKNQTFYSAYPQ